MRLQGVGLGQQVFIEGKTAEPGQGWGWGWRLRGSETEALPWSLPRPTHRGLTAAVGNHLQH